MFQIHYISNFAVLSIFFFSFQFNLDKTLQYIKIGVEIMYHHLFVINVQYILIVKIVLVCVFQFYNYIMYHKLSEMSHQLMRIN